MRVARILHISSHPNLKAKNEPRISSEGSTCTRLYIMSNQWELTILSQERRRVIINTCQYQHHGLTTRTNSSFVLVIVQ